MHQAIKKNSQLTAPYQASPRLGAIDKGLLLGNYILYGRK